MFYACHAQINIISIIFFFFCAYMFFCVGYIENGGTVSDYINTALQGHYDTDFPELTSKFENFSLSANDNQDLF